MTFNSEDETYNWAVEFGKSLRPGDMVALYGNLGAGKTVMSRGICKGRIRRHRVLPHLHHPPRIPERSSPLPFRPVPPGTGRGALRGRIRPRIPIPRDYAYRMARKARRRHRRHHAQDNHRNHLGKCPRGEARNVRQEKRLESVLDAADQHSGLP